MASLATMRRAMMRRLNVMTLHRMKLLNASQPFQVQSEAFKPRLKFEIMASMPERHFLSRVAIFLLLVIFCCEPLTLLKTILTIPLAWA